jgi:hypothetical protein
MAVVRYLKIRLAKRLNIEDCPSIPMTSSVRDAKRCFWGADALLVRSGLRVFNVSAKPEIYEVASILTK